MSQHVSVNFFFALALLLTLAEFGYFLILAERGRQLSINYLITHQACLFACFLMLAILRPDIYLIMGEACLMLLGWLALLLARYAWKRTGRKFQPLKLGLPYLVLAVVASLVVAFLLAIIYA